MDYFSLCAPARIWIMCCLRRLRVHPLMAQAYRCGVPHQDDPAPLPADVNIILFWGGMNCRDLYKTLVLDFLEVPDAIVEQRQELSFKEGERMIWPSSIDSIGKTPDGRYFAVHNMEEARAGPLPTEFCGMPAYGVFIACPNWDTINPIQYRQFLEWTTRNNNSVLASVFHGNPGVVINLAKGLERMGNLIELVKEMFPSATLLAVGPTPTYSAGIFSFDQYTQLCQRWEWLVKEKCTTLINFGSALSGNLFHQLVNEAVVKGDQRSMTGAFYPILLEVLAYILRSPPLNGASLKDVALLILQETLAIVTERYNDTNKRRLNASVFEDPAMYRKFRKAIRRSRRRLEHVPTDRLFEQCARDHFKEREKVRAVIDQYHRMGEEPSPDLCVFSFKYRQRRVASLAKVVKEATATVVKEDPPALLPVNEEPEIPPPTVEDMMDLFTDYGSEYFEDLPLLPSVTDVEPVQQTRPAQQPQETVPEAPGIKKEEEKEEEKTFAILVPMEQEAYQRFLNEHKHLFYHYGQQQQSSTTPAVHEEEQHSATPPASNEEEQSSTPPVAEEEEQRSTTPPAAKEDEPAKMVLRSSTIKRRIAAVEEPKKKKIRRNL